MANITVATRGICNPAWNGSYYPEDLPADWKLVYFANDFSACLLTTRDLHELAVGGEDFFSDLPEGFRIFLEPGAQPLPPLTASFFDRVTGFVVFANQSSDDSLPSLVRDTGKPYCLFVDQQDTSFFIRADEQAVALQPCHASPLKPALHCALIGREEAMDLRQLKGRLAQWLQNDNEEHMLLIDGGMDIEAIRNVTVLIQLLT
ncbi:MAG: hypothetical protein KDJ38_11790 [Gammaproteobacteria bacterium]|nr:hypothetical protein [Gammaproteobacteria bacterium]